MMRKQTVVRRTGLIVGVMFVVTMASAWAQSTVSFTVHPQPAEARVRIMNINPRYEPGIELLPGDYDLDVSLDGYFTYRQWITVTEDAVLNVALEPVNAETIRAREQRALAGGAPVYSFLNNSREVNRVAFSASGAYAVAAGYSVIRMWDIRSGSNIRNFRGHNGTVACVAISPDERYLAGGGYDQTLRLWDAATGEEIASFGMPHEGYVLSVAFSPDGRYLASAGMDNQIKLWDVETRELLRVFEGHVEWVLSLRFSADGALILSASDDYSIKIWETATTGLLASLYGFNRSTERAGELLDISPDGSRIIGVGGENLFVEWEMLTGDMVRAFSGHTGLVTSVKFSPDGRYIASSSADRTVRVWTPEGQEVAMFSGHHEGEVCDWINSVDISPDSRYILSGGCDDMLHIWLVPEF